MGMSFSVTRYFLKAFGAIPFPLVWLEIHEISQLMTSGTIIVLVQLNHLKLFVNISNITYCSDIRICFGSDLNVIIFFEDK